MEEGILVACGGGGIVAVDERLAEEGVEEGDCRCVIY